MGFVKGAYSLVSSPFRNTRAGQYVMTGTKGWGRASRYTLGVGSAYTFTDYQEKYGTGAMISYGVASVMPYVGAVVFAAEVAEGIGRYGYNRYHERRQGNFGTAQQDMYGTMSALKERSIQNLSRGRASRSRFISNEAYYFHR